VAIKDGTLVRVRILSTLSSHDARTGDDVRFTVANDVIAGDMTVIRRGAPAIGHVVVVEKKRRMGRPGKLAINIDSVEMITGKLVPLRANVTRKGVGHRGDIADASVRTFGLGTPVFLLVKGENVEIPAFTTLAAYVDGDVVLDHAQVTGLQPAPPVPTGLATIYVLRSQKNGDKSPPIYCGGVEIGQLRSQHYFEVRILPGEYQFQIPGLKRPIQVKAEPEKIYYLHVFPNSFLSGGYMELMDPLAGDDLLAFPGWFAHPKMDLSKGDPVKLRDTSPLPIPRDGKPNGSEAH